MGPELIKSTVVYFVEESKDNLTTIYKNLSDIQEIVHNPEILKMTLRATFSIKSGASMLGLNSIFITLYRLEKYLNLLRYPIKADEPLQLLFLDVYHVLKNLIYQIETPAGLTDEKADEITVNSDVIFTILNSHLVFLIDQSNYRAKITNPDSRYSHQPWSYEIPLKLILVDPQAFLCRTFEDYFANLPNVEIVNGYFEDLSFFDCIVTSASSLATNNDIDSVILEFFGDDVIKLLQQRVREEFLGEQPLGSSLIVETNHPLHPFIAHTPSLRMQTYRAGREHVYQSIWSTLLAVRKHNQLYNHCLQKQINIIAIPGLGTSLGRLPLDEVARQMSMAYQNFLYSFANVNLSVVS